MEGVTETGSGPFDEKALPLSPLLAFNWEGILARDARTAKSKCQRKTVTARAVVFKPRKDPLTLGALLARNLSWLLPSSQIIFTPLIMNTPRGTMTCSNEQGQCGCDHAAV